MKTKPGMACQKKMNAIAELLRSGKYSCTRDGRIFSNWIIQPISRERILLKKPRELTQRTMHGYQYVTLTDNGKPILVSIHRIMCIRFFGVFNEKLVPNHIDGNRKNNILENLELVTLSENIKHAYRLGRLNQVGRNNNGAKLSEKDVRKARALRSTGLSFAKIGKIMGYGPATICYACNIGWRHIS